MPPGLLRSAQAAGEAEAPPQTQIVLAFPLDDTTQQQLVYTYLPVRSAGFRFAMQGTRRAPRPAAWLALTAASRQPTSS